VRSALFDSALAYAEEGLRQDRGGEAASLEMRGTIRLHRSAVAPPPGDSGRLLELAESDLREALRLDDRRARAASTLFYISYARGQLQEARRYAEQALKNDAYLEEIANTVNNLFLAAFHLGDDRDASFWCEQVADYMPDRYPVAICRLMLLSWGREAPPDAKNALLQLTTAGIAESPERRMRFEPILMALTVPAVWRDTTYGGADSARVLLDRARALPGAKSPDFREFEAAALVAMEAYDGAFATLVDIGRQQPHQVARLEASRFFQPLFARGEAYGLSHAVVHAASAAR
jgi:tetratricopeptide (TPR) repeat protein